MNNQTPNRLTRLVQSLQKNVPAFAYNWALSFAIGRAVPYVGTSRVYFEKMAHDEVVLTLKNRYRVRNHIGQVHAVALTLLAETGSGMAIGMHLPDSKVPLIKLMTVQLTRRTSGAIKAVATVPSDTLKSAYEDDKGEGPVEVKITDATGEVVAAVTMLWAWRPKNVVKGAV